MMHGAYDDADGRAKVWIGVFYMMVVVHQSGLLYRQVIELAQGVDILLYECWDDVERAPELEGGRKRHAGALRAGRLATDCAAKTLVLVHSGPDLCRHGSMEGAIGDIREVFDGDVIFGEELLALDVGGGFS